MAAEPHTSHPGPPAAYRLDQVRVLVQRQFGHGQPGQTLKLLGPGSASFDADRRVSTITFDNKAVMALINGLYRLRFFDLPDDIGPLPSAVLKPDGTVGLMVTKVSDFTAVKVCFLAAGREKCVHYQQGAGPRELEDWVQGLLSDSARRAQQSNGGK